MKTFIYILAALVSTTISYAQTLTVGANSTTNITSNQTYTALSMGNNSNLYINHGNTLTINGNASASNGGDIYINGTLIISGTLSAGNSLGLHIDGAFYVGTISVANNSSLSVSGNGDIQVSGNFAAGNNTNIVVDVGGNVNVGGNMSIGGGTSSVLVNGTVIIEGMYSGPTPTGSGYMVHAGGVLLGSPLPVTLLSSNIYLSENNVTITWETASELNNDRFEIFRSTDLTNWLRINTIAGKGNSQQISFYSITDVNPPLGSIYYRIVQIDYDGSSDIIAMHTITNNIKEQLTIYPNPVMQGEPWYIKGTQDGDVVKIFNSALQPVENNNLTRGIYLILVNNRTPLKLIVK